MVKLKIEHSFNQSFELILLFFFILLNLSCSPDDDEDDLEPPRDYLEQSLDDDQRLIQYLKSHYYNYQDKSYPLNMVANQNVVSEQNAMCHFCHT